MEQIIKNLTSLEALPGLALVALACIVIGYVLKLIPKFPNAAIPLVVILCGMVLTPLCDEGKGTSESMRLWLVRHALVGMVVGFLAWFLHAQILKRFEEKIPFLGSLLTAAKTGSESEPSNAEAEKQKPTTGP